jgi:hypothetical protein
MNYPLESYLVLNYSNVYVYFQIVLYLSIHLNNKLFEVSKKQQDVASFFPITSDKNIRYIGNWNCFFPAEVDNSMKKSCKNFHSKNLFYLFLLSISDIYNNDLSFYSFWHEIIA